MILLIIILYNEYYSLLKCQNNIKFVLKMQKQTIPVIIYNKSVMSDEKIVISRPVKVDL